MAFRFSWPEFDEEFYEEAKTQLESALNKGNKPSVIVDHITVKELHMGTKAPDLEILEIGELGNDKFRGIFKLVYAGDAYIEIQTKVQANPMHAKSSELPRHSRLNILAADQPLVVPMILRISELKLRGIVVLVVSKTKGVTLVFKNDPLESIRISSTFDSISILRDFLQRQIEGQLRTMLQENLPVMIHNLSLRYIQSEEEKKKKLEQERRALLQEERLSRQHSTGLRRSNTYYSDTSLPDLVYPLSPRSQSSSLNTPISSSFDFHDNFDCYDDYLSASPSTHFGSYSESTLVDKQQSLMANCESTAFSNIYSKTAPMTAANLFSHNRRFNNASLGIYPTMHHSIYEPQDVQSEITLSLTDLYADDADAPWYTTEGPELPSANPTHDMFLDEKEITINPSENRMAARLSQLTSINYTLSPLTETVSNFTFRSLPYVKKPNMPLSRSKKVPKRRITKLNVSVPSL
ncbi:Mitochondrial distribution and morphology protein 34 [Choanephora cucurbitarum]|uniref:Mitochondrial distribution and morphology protein 34 n=1 Tax=Choanephora cucurbitarum TaxID=101091 RepID=A0A1C7N8J5_9FUNG|nr:Mitochondrial distribution and morphology protein 34 [Choanephora cucurbitarum]